MDFTYKITLISCSITIAVEGKFGIVLAEGVPYIVPMLDLSDDIICLYILQVFSSRLPINTPKFDITELSRCGDLDA